MKTAWRIRVRGVVQGVGFRPFVYRVAERWGITGWVLNGVEGVVIHAEGEPAALEGFVTDLEQRPPAAARVTSVEIQDVPLEGHDAFVIRASAGGDRPTARIPPDMATCPACLEELFDPRDPRYLYPYINCTDCGPRYTVIEGLPYDRCRTTMRAWEMCPLCAAQYADPRDRRFHAQPVACPRCGPHYYLLGAGDPVRDDREAIARAATLLKEGWILAVKGLGGYHLACDAENARAVATLRQRKRREDKPFALMVRDVETARTVVELSPEAEELLTSPARPIVLAPARQELPGVAPGNRDLGVMLPYTPLHHLLFHFGAPPVLVMTSANRSSEPTVYEDDDARRRLGDIADAFLMGERPIARYVDDSVTRVGPFGPMVIRRGRGYAPLPVASLPAGAPVLALGADLKNTVTLVVGGQAITSQHIGDLEHYEAYQAFERVVHDLLRMYEVPVEETVVAFDLHPDYRSSAFARSLPARAHRGVQHHRAHVAAVLAERGEMGRRVVGVAFDGTGYGDDGAIWGGEFFVGSLEEGLSREGHLRYAVLPGGDAAARFPAQAAAGFFVDLPDLAAEVRERLALPGRFATAWKLVEKRVRVFPTTSAGRLFDTVAALVGFSGGITFEGQAAIWLEHLARGAAPAGAYPMPWDGRELDFRPLLEAVVADRLRGRDAAAIARAFHSGLAEGIYRAATALAEAHGADVVVLSGGVFQNQLLLEDLKDLFAGAALEVWTGRDVPVNDGGISLGQAAVAATLAP